MAEKVLDIIINSTRRNAAEAEAAQKQIQAIGYEAQIMQGHIGRSTKAVEEHSLKERDLSRDAAISARAMGEVGAKGGELFERFTNLTTAAGGLQGSFLGIGLVAAGAVVEGIHKVDEAYQEQQSSTRSLQQAVEATGGSFEEVNKRFERFADQNADFVANENEARDALALFIRAGQDANQAMDSLGLA